jgi:branched-chain amino acid transport system permease protein
MLFLRRTLIGLAMRAASLDFEMVRLSGVRANRVFAIAFMISGLLAGIACILSWRGAAQLIHTLDLTLF